MRCDEALAVHLQGDAATPSAVREARHHIRVCPRCAAAVDGIDDRPTDDEVAETLARLKAEQQVPRLPLRVLLFVLSVVQLALAVPWLAGVNPLGGFGADVDPSHLTRDGALALLVSVAGITVAVRPRYAVPAVLITGAAVVAQVVAGAIDQDRDHVHATFEVVHLLVLAIVALIAVCAVSRGPSVREPDRRPRLRSGGDPDAS